MRPVNVSVVTRVAVMWAEDVPAGYVMLRVTATIRQNAFTRKPPLGYEEWLGRISGIYGPEVTGMVCIGAILWSNVCVMSPILTVSRIGWTSPTFFGPCAHWINLLTPEQIR